jgi:CRISPR-associated protein Cmr1
MIDNLQRAVAMKMIERRYTVRFLTPAFLGDVEQNGRWRTPPFKHLLREWWRVAYAAEKNFKVNLEEMRREEGLLFGHAWLDDDRDERGQKVAGRKSLVRIRLDRWDEGDLKRSQWPGDVFVTHPEVKNREGRLVPVGNALYMGFGPLTYDNQRRATTLKANAAIQVGEAAELSIAVPDEHALRIRHALRLVHLYGTLGGRSRNGWGSYVLLPLPLGEGRGEGTALSDTVPLRNWRDCLALDWPHAIGKDDDGALIWQTAPHADWKALMRTLAIVKIGLRTQFKLILDTKAGDRQLMKGGKPAGINHARPHNRHWLSYPVTNHSVAAWGSNTRLPNQLRFKVRRTEAGQLVGVIFHMPHLPPEAFRPNRDAIEAVWACVHAFLDALCQPADQRRYCDRANAEALGAQKEQLDKVQLQRIGE